MWLGFFKECIISLIFRETCFPYSNFLLILAKALICFPTVFRSCILFTIAIPDWSFVFIWKRFESLCPLFFIKFLFFQRMRALQKLWKMFFISSKKLSRYSIFCNFFLHFHTIQTQKDKWKWNNLWCHKLVLHKFQM